MLSNRFIRKFDSIESWLNGFIACQPLLDYLKPKSVFFFQAIIYFQMIIIICNIYTII